MGARATEDTRRRQTTAAAPDGGGPGYLVVQHVTRRYPAETFHAPQYRDDPAVARAPRHGMLEALQDVTLHVGRGEFVSLIGPSGCGKSTLLNIIAGVDHPDDGRVWLAGRDITGRPGEVSYMPQRDLLMPWRTVLDNCLLAPELQGTRQAAQTRALGLLGLFGLEGFGHSYPSVLSGGMRQRAALLRTVLIGRDPLLLDEPFGALDALTRRRMWRWLAAVRRELGLSVLLVTHDVDEALALSDRIYVMSPRPGHVVAELSLTAARVPGDVAVGAAPEGLRARILAELGLTDPSASAPAAPPPR